VTRRVGGSDRRVGGSDGRVGGSDCTAGDGIEELRRWEDAGGTWRVLRGRADDDGGALVSLCRCDGGEEVERIRLTGAAVATYLALRRSSEDPEPS
jgi:hypothetical protein